ncbi:hypothetical protein [Bacteroides fluxus]|uniref:hypothetical protein n=1 Tax=Bacteroides fluxus TaxID=626930 RepID=UPI002A83815C|nr:hypothetical protein [Bacteroides fluxus]MDY3789534.1 hypothetical protein [Bacteroides fluxus]
MKNRIAFLILLIMGALSAYSQTIITGTIKNKKGEPILATVTLQRLGTNTIAGFASTDDAGKYKAVYKGSGDSILVVVRGLMVEQTTRCIPNCSAMVNFTVVEKVNKLKEVSVTASPVRRKGDTLTYAVGVFAGQSDRTIEDVMKKLPGIEVSSSGGISYNGKEISNFYIEDLDMLGGRYNVATRNIEAKDVASIQVYENHQPIKANPMFSDQTAINLRLKDNAKGIWTVNALAGIGYEPVLWNAELTAMHFARNRQHISMYKGNNSGHTADEELRKYYDTGAAIAFTGSILSVTQPGTPNVARKRYIDNRTNSISVNQLLKVKETELTANINYYNERLDKEGYSSSVQYLPDDTPLVIEETVNNVSKENNLSMELSARSNKDREFFSNKLEAKASWNRTYTDALSTSNRRTENSAVFQHLDRPCFSVANALNMMKRINNHVFRIRFNVDYNDCPHRLCITPAYYFSGDSLEVLSQEVVQRNMNATLHTSYGLNLGDFSLNYTPRFNMNLRKLTSELTGRDGNNMFLPAADSMRNNLWYNNYQIGVDQDYTYKKYDRLRIKLTIPTYFSVITNNNRLSGSSVNYKQWIVNPALTADYSFTPSFKVVLNGYYRKSYGNMNDAYTGYILQSYRNLLRNMGDRLFASSVGGGHLSLEYRDAIRMLFFNVTGSYQHSWKNLFYGYSYENIVGIKTFVDQPTRADTYRLYASASKTFRFWRTKVGFSAGFSKSDSELFIQNKAEAYNSKKYFAGISFNTTPCRYVNWVYDFSWSRTEQKVESTLEGDSPLRSHSHEFKLWIFPNEALSINFNVDYQYYNKAGNRNMAFADALVRYKYKQTEWELECNNLFNAKRYVSTTYSAMSTYVSQYELRPLSLLLKVRFKLK